MYFSRDKICRVRASDRGANKRESGACNEGIKKSSKCHCTVFLYHLGPFKRILFCVNTGKPFWNF